MRCLSRKISSQITADKNTKIFFKGKFSRKNTKKAEMKKLMYSETTVGEYLAFSSVREGALKV